MAQSDPLQFAAAAYTAERWGDDEWRQFGRETGTSDILNNHPRLYRSLGFGDNDYPDAAISVLGLVLREALENETGESGRMELLADSMPDLPSWIAANAPARTKRLFREYIAARDVSEIPAQWSEVEHHNVFEDYGDATDSVDASDPDSGTFERISSAPTGAIEPHVSEEAAVPELITPTPNASAPAAPPPKLFIVHGHDEAARDSIRIFVHGLTGLLPMSLAEEAGKGATIIEKFEGHGGAASFVIVLLTPDDVGQTLSEHEAGILPNPRARQNVVLELGYFIGKIGRKNIVVVNASVERPSDLAGLSYVQYPGDNWKDALRVELKAAGLTS